MPQTYSSDSIKVLSDREHIQLRKEMYIGEANDPRPIFSEIYDNAIDEVQAGFSSEMVISVDTKKNEYSIRDYGRGIPHGKKKLEDGQEKEILEVILTKSNSGGKFDKSSYLYSSGLHGLGVTVTNALSKSMTMISYRKGKYVKAETFGTQDVKLSYGKSKESDGTLVIFNPDERFFNNKAVPVDFIKDRCRVASALGFRARLIVDGVEIDTNATMFDLIREDRAEINTYVKIDPIEVESSTKEKMRVAMQYTSETNDRYFGYTNLLVNYLGGTHVQELAKCVSETWKLFVEKHKAIRPTVELHNNDYLVGLRAVCAVFISDPHFSSQTKEKLVVSKKYFDELMGLFSKQLYKYLDTNIVIAQQLIKRFEEYRIAQNALLSRKEIGSLIQINTDSGDNIRRRSVVSKLVECTSKKKDGTELFLVEGNSALGPFLFTRNKETQAILPLRGKILNVTFKTIKEAVQNSEVCDIANSIGAGIGSACDASKSRYSRIIISSDADEDGKHITSLLASLFVNLFPDLVKAGMVWIALPPLYCWGKDSKSFGWCNNIKEIPKNVKDFHRFKGLGEMENIQLKYFCVDPDTRREMCLEYPSDIEEFNRIVGSSQGKNDLLKELGIIIEGDI